MTVPAADNLRRWAFDFGYAHYDPPAPAADLLDAIDALHQPDDGLLQQCRECLTLWPCPTARLLHPEPTNPDWCPGSCCKDGKPGKCG